MVAIIGYCTFINNSTRTSYADVISLQSTSVNSSISNCTFINNYASTHGGVITNYGDLTHFIGCIFINNTTSTSDGAIANVFTASNNGTANINITKCDFINNVADTFSGAIFNANVTALVSNDIMSDNSAGLGWMIYNNSSIGILNLNYLNKSKNWGV